MGTSLFRWASRLFSKISFLEMMVNIPVHQFLPVLLIISNSFPLVKCGLVG